MKRENQTKINLRNLGSEPEEFSYSEKDEWVADFLRAEISRLRRQDAPARFHARLSRDGKNFVFDGELEVMLTPPCDRCGKEFPAPMRADFSILLIPPTSHQARPAAESAEEEAALYEDEASSILAAEEVDLADYFREQTFLALPMTFVCRPDCPGLCPRCGKDLSTGLCACKAETSDDRWAALKAFKSGKRPSAPKA